MDHRCTHCDHGSLAPDRPAQGGERRLIGDLLQAMDRPSALLSEIAVGSHFIGLRAEGGGVACAGPASTLGAAALNAGMAPPGRRGKSSTSPPPAGFLTIPLIILVNNVP